MRTYNITHMYLPEDSGVYIKTSVSQEGIEDAIALICFTLEEVVDECACAHEELLVKCLKAFYPLKVKDAKANKEAPQIDQYSVREIRCGSFYEGMWPLYKESDHYKIMKSIIENNTDLYNV